MKNNKGQVAARTLTELTLFFLILFLLGAFITGCSSAATKALYPGSKVESPKEVGVYENDKGPVIFYLHGNGTNIASLEQINLNGALQSYGKVIIPEYPGYGPYSSEAPSQKVFIEKLSPRLREAKLHAAIGRRFVLVGRSLGAAVASQLASIEGVDRLILISPWTSAKEAAEASESFMVKFMLKFVGDDFFEANEWNSVKAARTHKVPSSVIHGAHDTLIPFLQGQTVAAALNAKLYLIDGGHNDLFSKQEFWAAFEHALKED